MKQPKTQRTNSQSGFTLIELAVVITVASLIIVAGVKAYDVYFRNAQLSESLDKVRFTDSSIKNFSNSQSRLPCPADLTLPSTSPNHGIEDCSLLTSGAAYGSCTGPAGTGVCVVAGARDTDGDGVLDPVLIGGVPYQTMRQAFLTSAQLNPSLATSMNDADIENTLDPWDYQMTYAVSGNMTSPASFRAENGVITIQTETGIPLSDPVGSAQYALIAHGDNNMGAYTLNGQVTIPCAGAGADIENCNNDSIFVSGIRSDNVGPNYYDDTVSYTAYSILSIWGFADSGGDIMNLNPGNVGVGVNTPAQRLEVIDSLRADEFSMSEMCDTTGANCWTPYTEIDCPTASAPNRVSVVTAFKFGQAVCTEVTIPTILPGQTCPATEFVLGVRADGTLICGFP